MGSLHRFFNRKSLLLALLLLPQSVFALLNIDGTRNQIFVFGELSLDYNSNIFAQKGGGGDFITTGSVGTEYKRGAGTLAVDASAILGYAHYNTHSDRNSVDPSFRLALDRTTGRLTGSLVLSATHSSQADSAINLLTSTWNYPVDLNLRYPINEKFYITSATSYLQRTYADAATLGLSNITEYSEGIDLFKVYTSKLDLLAGYRIRLSDTTAGRSTDNNFSVGATGGLLPKLNGLVRFGYQFRNVDATSRTPTAETFHGVSALTQLTWNATRKFVMVGQLSRDFTTSANTISIDSLAGNLHANYVLTRRYQVDGGVGYGRNHFLNQSERGRQDEFFTADAGITYTLSEKFKATLSYVFLQNWSTLDQSNFISNSVKLTLSSRF